MKQAMFESMHGLLGLVNKGLQSCPHQQRTCYMVALDTRLTALPIFKTRELPRFTVRLLNLPAHGAHLFGVLCRIWRQVVSYAPFLGVVDMAAQQKLALLQFADFPALASTLPFPLPPVSVA